MKTLTVIKVARNFSAVLDGVERRQEEVVLVRNRRPIARLVPEPPGAERTRSPERPLPNARRERRERARGGHRGARKGKRGKLDELGDAWDS